MTKEEAIKEAWDELNIYISGHINNNGWLDIKPTQYSRIYDKVDILKFSNHKHSIRPKSLAGIENNNGWIKIESEADLPRDDNLTYWGANDNGVFDDYIFTCKSINIKWRNGTLTHYQPIKKLNPPIY